MLGEHAMSKTCWYGNASGMVAAEVVGGVYTIININWLTQSTTHVQVIAIEVTFIILVT